MRERADKLLHKLGYFESRKKAQVAIKKKLIQYVDANGTYLVEKASEEINESEVTKWLIAEHPEFRFVSRSGYKLQAAIDHIGLDVENTVVLDVGLSTGGFTDCLLQNGCKFVVGVDVGRDQLHESLKAHPSLQWHDKINAKEPLPINILNSLKSKIQRASFDLIVVDVSFISLVSVLLPQLQFLENGGAILALFKPQFEVGKEKVGKKGLVAKDDGLIVLKKAVNTVNDLGLRVKDYFPAVIEGEDGNQEYFIFAHYKPSNI